MNRRRFLLSSAGLFAAGSASACFSHRKSGLPFEGAVLGASADLGHRLIQRKLPPPRETRTVPVVIVGGGISGLSAGWKLLKAGFGDFEMLEMEPEIGGNARSGENQVSAYPWGAHYLPIPTAESHAVRELLEELGVIESYTASGKPLYRDEYLCFAPQERLYIHGRWQDSLLPLVGVTQRDLDQYARFRDIVIQYRNHEASDGRKAFAIPMEMSSKDEDLLALDRLSMRDFMLGHELDSRPLHWFVDYACRDDYGCHYGEVSAWAGVHYFASRPTEGEEMEGSSVLTWPEGNGWIVKRLQQKLQPRISTNALVFRIERQGNNIAVDYFDPLQNRSVRLFARDVIFSAPTFLTNYLLNSVDSLNPRAVHEFQYAPWLVANLTLKAFPVERAGAPLAWDNVIYDSKTLGYVVATHQTLRTHLKETVFTFYHALADGPPTTQRSLLFDNSWQHWAEFIVRDLSKPHPEIRALITRLDLFRWGHAMVRPRVGFVWGEARQLAAKPHENLHLAHSDLSGFSIFEEAQYRGVLAAERILRKLQVPFTSSI